MDRAKGLPKVKDALSEKLYGYVYAVSGPGKTPTPIYQIGLLYFSTYKDIFY